MSHLQGFSTFLGEGTEIIPLIADLLTPGIDTGRVIIVQLTIRSGGKKDKKSVKQRPFGEEREAL